MRSGGLALPAIPGIHGVERRRQLVVAFGALDRSVGGVGLTGGQGHRTS